MTEPTFACGSSNQRWKTSNYAPDKKHSAIYRFGKTLPPNATFSLIDSYLRFFTKINPGKILRNMHLVGRILQNHLPNEPGVSQHRVTKKPFITMEEGLFYLGFFATRLNVVRSCFFFFCRVSPR